MFVFRLSNGVGWLEIGTFKICLFVSILLINLTKYSGDNKFSKEATQYKCKVVEGRAKLITLLEIAKVFVNSIKGRILIDEPENVYVFKKEK